MKLRLVFELCEKMADKLIKQGEQKGFKTPEGIVTFEQLKHECSSIKNWCYQEEIDIQKVTRCKNCVNYRKFKTKSRDGRAKIVQLCALDKKPKQPDYYCSDARERKE